MVKCLYCRNNISGEAHYCINYDKPECLGGAHHPSCGGRAGRRDDGSYRKCCREVEKTSEKNSSNSSLNDSTPEEFDDAAGEMTMNDMLKQMKSLINQSANAINKNVDEKTSSIASQITGAVLRIGSLEADMGTIKQEMTEIKHRVSKMETFQTDDKHQLGEQLIAETKERMHREKNIIIFGVDENDETDDLKEEIISLFSGAPFSLEEIQLTQTKSDL
ncbi:hypothetical protein QAD02_007669 [Eretmocerus hayati]|uniref:Uncharacterized protein n=1 Tax=Eretmocerus hayati TaxID=131215 RepID=A0ACC2N4L7_9HYME|nr:hypothetical protein QAD02_007669 [Eretmocerus hayati]